MTEHSKMQSEQDRVLTDALAHAHALAAAGQDEAHPDDVALAAYVDGLVAGSEREQMEDHLGRCDVCRELVAVTAIYAKQEQTTTAESRSEMEQARPEARPSLAGRLRELIRSLTPPQPLLAAAVALVVVALAWLAMPLLRPHPADDFGGFSEGGDVLRGPQEEAITLISPSFETVATTRPDFRAAFSAAAAGAATRGRLLVIDEEEQPVGFAQVQLQAEGDALVVHYPDSWPDLEGGAVYAWKLDVEQDGSWLPSAFTPFRVEAGAAER